MSARAISQRELPGMSRLYGDYLYDFARVARFYPEGSPHDLDSLARRAPAVARQSPPRPSFPHDAVAIVTGQQAGLFGGPLLCALKAMTAVLLAEQLRARGVHAVPVFWIASQDHDLAEIDHAWTLDAAGVPRCLRAPLDAPAGTPASRAQLPASLPAAPDPLTAAAYTPGATLAQAFARWLKAVFAPWGLFVFDPTDETSGAPGLQTAWQPIYQTVFERQAELSTALAGRNASLVAAGYHVQVEQTAAASMLFIERDGLRLGLHRRGDAWMAGDQPITAGEIRAAIADHPASISPSALLRPVLQDIAFPTLAQVTGPAETAYLAQSAVLYEALGIRQPLPWPRASATLLDAKTRRLLEKYQLPVESFWRSPANELLARQALPAGIEANAAAMRQHFEADLTSLTAQLQTLDPSLADAASGAAQKIRHQMEQLETRVARSYGRRSEELAGQAQFLTGHLFPERQLPERFLAGASYAAASPDWLQQIHDQLDPTSPDHQLIPLS